MWSKAGSTRTAVPPHYFSAATDCITINTNAQVPDDKVQPMQHLRVDSSCQTTLNVGKARSQPSAEATDLESAAILICVCYSSSAQACCKAEKKTEDQAHQPSADM